MLFWIAAACLTLAAAFAVLAPLSGGARFLAGGRGRDIEVYRDQLAEVDRDLARGLIAAPEAEQARAEISRRILHAGDSTRGARISGNHGRWIGMAAVLAVPIIAWSLYAFTGSPGLEGQPLHARLAKNPADSTIEELVGRAELHLRENPSDVRGWEVLAPIYLRTGHFDDSVTAYRNAIRLAGPSLAREAGLGEALAAAAGGVITADAQGAFERALTFDPKDERSRFYLAQALAQEGRRDEAARQWQVLAADLPETSPWRTAAVQAAQRAIAQAPAPGPSREDVEDAAAMSERDRSEMIRTMVASLDRRLRDEPADGEGWKRLVRSYLVLGEADKARDALRRGSAALGDATAEGQALVAYAVSLGLTVEE